MAVSRGIFGASATVSALALFGAVAPVAHAAPATQPARPPTASEDRSIAVQLDRKLPEVTFDGVALADAIDFLRDVTGMKIEVNWEALQTAGVARETPITVRMRDVKTSKALSVILDSVHSNGTKLHQAVERGRDGGRVVITTWDDYVAHNTEEHEYDLRDLLPPGADGNDDASRKARAQAIDRLSQLLQETVAPQSWVGAGGKPGAIKEKEGRLVVTQTKEYQQRVGELLDRMREAKARPGGATRPAPPRPEK